MGNYISCTLMSVPLIKNSKSARVIFPGGEIKQFREPIKAAELMLDCPNFFLANSSALHVGRRFSALSADEELEFGNLYIMFPMKRVNYVVTAADMTICFMAANSAAKRISTGSGIRILPEQQVAKVKENNNLILPEQVAKVEENNNPEDGGLRLSFEGLGIDQITELKYRLSICRSKKPTLETIKEEPICSR